MPPINPFSGATRPPRDLTLKEAEQEAATDYKRLAHGHIPSWSVNVFHGTIRWTCSCWSPGPRNAAEMDAHLLDAVRKARGPTRAPKKK